MPLETWGAASLVLLALWILLSGLDDLFIDLVFVFSGRGQVRRPTETELASAPRRRIALVVPLWREQSVIGRMLRRNLSAIRYDRYEIFVGVYPNDAGTASEALAVAREEPRVHVAVCPHDGPTSKADCLNSVYRQMSDYEAECCSRFDLVVVHDAEDLIHPDALRLIDWFARDHDMVQIPVLPLPTPMTRWTHGLYCDEFAEYQLKDIPVRQKLGGFMASNGVGTGYRREALERLAREQDGNVFDPDCLTEDYEIGLRLYEMGCRQVFVELECGPGPAVATREYFPMNFRAAVRQRARWVAGIVLQGWERHGWRGGWRSRYWFWRDRKGLIGNLLSPAANAALALTLTDWALGDAGLGAWFALPVYVPPPVRYLCVGTLGLSVLQLAVRTALSGRVYGRRFAAGVLFRALLGNAVNLLATVSAVRQFAAARLERRRLEWRKTEHLYPAAVTAVKARPRLGEVLVLMRRLSHGELAQALSSKPDGVRIGEHLKSLRIISHEDLYQALDRQHGMEEAMVLESLRV